MTLSENALNMHRIYQEKLETVPKVPVRNAKDLSLAYSPEVDAFPICLKTTNVEKIIETVKLFEPTIGGVNLEDISTLNFFVIEDRLKKEMNIPVFDDDQTVAGLVNALCIVGRPMSEIKIGNTK